MRLFNSARLRRAVLIAFGLALPALAMAWQFPGRPVDADRECRPNDWSYTDEGQEYVVKRDQGYKALDYGKSCDSRYRAPSREWTACYSEGMRRQGQFVNEMNDYRSRAIARFNQARQQCVNVANQNARLLQQQKEQAAENQRQQQRANADAERRQHEAQAEVARQQREQQNAHNQAAAKQQAEWARLQSENDARVRQQQAQAAQQAARQVPVPPQRAAQADPSPFNPATRNEPRIVQTPQMAAQLQEQARAEARRDQIEANIQTGKALKSLYGTYTGAKEFAADPDSGVIADKLTDRAIDQGNDLRRDALGQALNPQGYKNEAIDNAFESASKEGARIDRYRDTSPVASQMREDANAGIQAVFNNTDGQLNNTINSLDELASPSSQSGNYAQPAQGPLEQADQVDSLDQLADAIPRSPNDACKLLAGTAASQCLANQCQLTQFTQHPTCRSLTP